jgi:hypothetical protein
MNDRKRWLVSVCDVTTCGSELLKMVRRALPSLSVDVVT